MSDESMNDEKRASRGPATCPVTRIGAAFDAFDAESYSFYARARIEEPIFYSPQIGFWVVARYRDIREILQGDPEVFSAEKVLELLKPLCPAAMNKAIEYGLAVSPTIVDEDPPGHTPHRQALRRGFTPERVAAMEPRTRELITNRIDVFIKRGHADLVTDLMFEVPALIILEMMGVPRADLMTVRKFAKRLAVFEFGHPSDDEQIEITDTLGEFWRYCRQHVDRLIDHAGDDAVSNFIAGMREASGSQPLDRQYLTTVTFSIIFAGHETTTNAAAGAFRALLENRSQWQALCGDPSLITNAVEESLRFYPSVPQWRRITKRPVTIGGVDLPAGSRLLLALGSGNRDAGQFADGDTFDIRRANAGEHLAFGWGRHHCLGDGLARMEMRVALEELSRRLPHMQLVGGQQWEFSPNASFRGPEHVRVTWDPSRNPVSADRP
jgi:cytochrome P450